MLFLGTTTFLSTQLSAQQGTTAADPLTEPSIRVAVIKPFRIYGTATVEERGGVVVLDGIDLVSVDRDTYKVLDGTPLTSKLIAPSARHTPRVVIAFEDNEPVRLKLWTWALDASFPEREIYEITVTPTVRDWETRDRTTVLPFPDWYTK